MREYTTICPFDPISNCGVISSLGESEKVCNFFHSKVTFCCYNIIIVNINTPNRDCGHNSFERSNHVKILNSSFYFFGIIYLLPHASFLKNERLKQSLI